MFVGNRLANKMQRDDFVVRGLLLTERETPNRVKFVATGIGDTVLSSDILSVFTRYEISPCLAVNEPARGFSMCYVKLREPILLSVQPRRCGALEVRVRGKGGGL